MCSIPPLCFIPVSETHVEFVDQFAALQTMAQLFLSQFTLSQTFQLCINDGPQLFFSGSIAAVPCVKKFFHFCSRLGIHGWFKKKAWHG